MRFQLLCALSLCFVIIPPSSAQDYPATTGLQPGVAALAKQSPQALPEYTLERISSLVPWPRGIVHVDGKLYVVARGRHRNYGGPAPDVMDQEATLFEIDPNVTETYEKGKPATAKTMANGRILAEPDARVVHLYDRSKSIADNWTMQRPFCTLTYDAASRNLIFCAYSGADLSAKGDGPTFRKNATDGLIRYDLRNGQWNTVELHRADVVPHDRQGQFISNEYYPHHDPAKNPPPHGLLNGPNGCAVVGRYLYAVGKDNHTLARYDLEPIRKDPNAGAPPARAVLGEKIDVRIDGKVRSLEVKGHSAVTSHGNWLYLASRTSSLILRFPITADGALVEPIVGEIVAELEPYSKESKRSADLWDMTTHPSGDLVVSCSRNGRVWRFRPDPSTPFDGNDHRKENPTPNRPWIDIRAITGQEKASISNMTFGPDGHLYFCMTMPEPDRAMAGIVMRAKIAEGAGDAR